MKNTIIMGIIAVTVLYLGFLNLKSEISNIGLELEHIDDEVDEMSLGVKRILSRSVELKSSGESTEVQVDLLEYDFGKIKKEDGIVTTDFHIKNIGSADLVIGDILTSCGCTSAMVNSIVVAPSKSAVLKVSFDPNFHKEPEGRFSRSVFVPTNDLEMEEIEFKIFVEII